MKRIVLEIKWIYREVLKTFSSNEKSFFSSKRIERFAFVFTALFAANYWFYTHVSTLTYEMVIAFVLTFLAAAGYNLRATQKEKKTKNKENEQD